MNKIDRILNKINDLNCELMTNIYENKIENSTKIYGNKNNTIEQFLEFYKYKTGKDFIINMTIPSQATES